MSPENTIEQRLAILERRLEELHRQVTALAPKTSWIEQMAGSMRRFPDFPEVLRLGREIREACQPPEEPAEGV
jgi:hypothetical protein